MVMFAEENGCPWNEKTCADAAEGGHLDVLKYLHENGCPWNEKTCESAAEYGHLDVLKYARENGCPWDGRTWYWAAESVRVWLKEKGCPQEFEDNDNDEHFW